MKRPLTMDGMPLMASTKIRTGRRNLERLSLRKNAVAAPKGSDHQQGEPDLLDRPDDGVQASARRGRHGRGDASLVVDEEAGSEGREPLDDDVADQPDEGDEHHHHGAGHGDGDDPVHGTEPADPVVRGHEVDGEKHEIGDDPEQQPADAIGQDRRKRANRG